jgi:hypothetical protein
MIGSPNAGDLAEIHHVQSVYNNAGDRGRIEDVAAVFTPNGILEVPGGAHCGRDAIKAFLGAVVEAGAGGIDLRGARHHLTTCRIESDGPDEARGWTYFFVMRAGTVIEEGTYIDHFQRCDEGWRIAHRRVKLLWTVGDRA